MELGMDIVLLPYLYYSVIICHHSNANMVYTRMYVCMYVCSVRLCACVRQFRIIYERLAHVAGSRLQSAGQ